MSLTATTTVDALADVSLRVPRGQAGDLERGVADVIESVDGVEAVSVDGVTGVTPTFTDIRVDADVRLTLSVATPDSESLADGVVAHLEDGFGVETVAGVAVDDPG
jgi:hypothetical protein